MPDLVLEFHYVMSWWLISKNIYKPALRSSRFFGRPFSFSSSNAIPSDAYLFPFPAQDHFLDYSRAEHKSYPNPHKESPCFNFRSLLHSRSLTISFSSRSTLSFSTYSSAPSSSSSSPLSASFPALGTPPYPIYGSSRTLRDSNNARPLRSSLTRTDPLCVLVQTRSYSRMSPPSRASTRYINLIRRSSTSRFRRM